MTIGDQPAFPHEFTPEDKQWSGAGMTYRQWLVGQIANGHAANSHLAEIEMDNQALVDMTIAFADAIIKRMEELT